MYFTRLRLAGFKTFVEPTDLLIETGLTGVVGPNGCGKSNLVEALRWVMGETSARQMRGTEMDDMIFGGTTGRPARNLAEVTLSVDNAERRAPAAFNDHTELEVTRRIDRGKGSTYRVNGRDVRARDVQLLFADAATGARSPSLVSQGQIGKLINSPPSERRVLLEDAAGISGLHSRRHEAELRLKAAETNLERLEDVLSTLDQQFQGLKRQARQAARYRQLTEQIRSTEACLLAGRWQAVVEARSLAGEGMESARFAIREAVERAAVAAGLQADAAAQLPDLRRAESDAAARLQKAELELAGLDAEERRISEAARTIEIQRQQIERDLERERQIADDAGEALAQLADEAEALSFDQMTEEEAQEEAEQRLAEAEDQAEQADHIVSERAQAMAGEEAMRTTLDKRVGELEQRSLRLTSELERIESQRDDLAAELADSDSAEEDEIALAEAEEKLDAARQALEEAGDKRQQTAQALDRASQHLRDCDGRLARLKGEIDGVAASLSPDRKGKDGPAAAPLLDDIRVTPGQEAALGAMLGDDLAAPLASDGTKGAHWRALPPLPASLPAGVAALAGHVQAPAALVRRLGQTGLASDLGDALARQADLTPGQRLVTPTGDMVRWDGFVQPAGAPSLAATRLALRNRLAALEAERELVAAERDELADRVEQARYAANAAQSFEQMARNSERLASDALAQLRQDAAKRRSAAEAARNRLIGLEQAIDRLARDCAENDQAIADALDQLDQLADPAQAREALAAARTQLAEKRAAVTAARAERDRLRREADQRRQRLAAITREQADWQRRVDGTQTRLDDLAERQRVAEDELATLATLPDRLAGRRDTIQQQVDQAGQDRRAAADRLAHGEARLRECDQVLRTAEAEVAQRRESLVRAEAQAETAARDAVTLAERIRERLDCSPDEVRALTGLPADAPLPDAADTQPRLDKLIRDRDGMGPVNLRAETEAAELESQINGMVTEREDLLSAIQRLRSAIATLNREGRERLLASFELVNRHFEDLFVRLFGGGKARLELTQSDDPLAAGLEIMASPPGKTPKVLSLLSGGESALTALSLIFAVFLTNPSPICVLDEVDAPLDDSNVDRFCALLEAISAETGTRFLVVTHHRMTMARMDRLFGVTMVERGVSQLVSVDLTRAEKLAGPPRAA